MSPRTPRLTARQVERVLAKHGFVLAGQRGSHRKWRHVERQRVVVVPEHANRVLPIGTLRSIMTGAGLAEGAWEER